MFASLSATEAKVHLVKVLNTLTMDRLLFVFSDALVANSYFPLVI